MCLTAVFAFKIGASRDVEVAARAEAAAPALNACGCYRDSAGACFCGKKGGKCVCPGECEPQGCEEKRAKELQKEVDAEAKRAREAEKKQQNEQAERAEKARKAEAASDDEEAGGSADDKAEPADKKKAESTSRKDDDDDSSDDKGPKKKGHKTPKGAKIKHGKDDSGDKVEKGGGVEG